MDITISDCIGAKKFIDFVSEQNLGFTESYQKFLELMDDINRKMLDKFEDEVDKSMDKMEASCDSR